MTQYSLKWLTLFVSCLICFTRYQSNEPDYPTISIERDVSMLIVHYSADESVGYPILPGTLSLLINERAPNYLELTDDQRVKLKEIAATALESAQHAATELLKKRCHRTEMERLLDEKLSEITDQIDLEVQKNVLLPHQLAWLERYPVFLFVQQNGLFKFLAYTGFGTKLNIRDEQRRLLEEKADKLREKIKKIAIDIENQIFDELTSVLDPDQIEQIDWLKPTFEGSIDFNLKNKLYHLDRANIGSCIGCDASKAILPLPKSDKELKSVIER